MMKYRLANLTVAVCSFLCFSAGAQNASCNVHCMFRYLGYDGVKDVPGFQLSSFLDAPVYPITIETAFPSFKALRALNMYLCQLEYAMEERKSVEMTNSAAAISHALKELSVGEGREILDRALEMVCFSLARMVLRKGEAAFDLLILENLLPEELLTADDMPKALETFKRMIVIAWYVEKFRCEHGRLPLTLEAVVPEKYRKCSYGHDIEYSQRQENWDLYCGCDSWCDALSFDEYLPGILSDRKKLPLHFSTSFNQKRVDVFSGEWVFASDPRLTCRIDHSRGGGTNGIHGLTYKSPGAGASRIIGISKP